MAEKFNLSDPARAGNRLAVKLRYHPARIFTWLIIAGISTVFLFLSSSYLFTTLGRDFHNFRLPLLFHANTVLILMSSYVIHQAVAALKKGDRKAYRFSLLITFAAGLAFIVFQFVAWQELLRFGLTLQSNVAAAYLYVISGLHLFHVAVGLFFLGWFYWKDAEADRDPVKALLAERNPFELMKVELMALYWHFVDALWLYLYLFFVLNVYYLNA